MHLYEHHKTAHDHQRAHTTDHDHVPDRNAIERDCLDLLKSCSVVAKVVYVGK